ncbi:Protein CURVATURE THYLAKOID 1B, chloroplastic [Linum grandiflorum]
MASTSSATLSISSSIVDAKAPRHSLASSSSSQTVTLPTLPPPPTAVRSSFKPTTYCRKIARNVMAMATGEASPAEVVSTTEMPEIVKTIQDAWDKVEDKYAVSSLGVAAALAIWSSSGMISAIDRLPLVPGVLEIVGIGYSGWFAYKNLFYKPDREALIQKVKDTYKDITGSS